jgi:hypothetical protein
MSEPLSKVDSAVQGLSSSPPTKTEDKKTRRQSSAAAPGVWNVNDLEAEGRDLELAPETQKTGWKINTSPGTIEDPAILKLPLSEPPVKRIDLHFPLGKEVTARNLKGVTIKDALDAIHKAYKKRVCFQCFCTSQLAHANMPPSLMMSSTSPTSLVSSGTRKSHGPDLLFTFRLSPQAHQWAALVVARRRRTRSKTNKLSMPPWYLFQ